MQSNQSSDLELQQNQNNLAQIDHQNKDNKNQQIKILSKNTQSSRQFRDYTDHDKDDDDDVDDDDDDQGGEEAYTTDTTNNNAEEDPNEHLRVTKDPLVVCLPSPNIAIESAFGALSSSPSFCIDPRNNKSNLDDNPSGNLLNANDVFSRSQNLIKRPSTFLVNDAMSQVARALNSTSPSNQQQQQQQQQQSSVVLRNRRQAIVPPKLTTDGRSSDDIEAEEGNLVDVSDECSLKREQVEGEDGNKKNYIVNSSKFNQRQSNQDFEDAEIMRAHRRKRSGGSSTTNIIKGLSGSQNALPTFHIEQDDDQNNQTKDISFQPIGTPELVQGRTDSQMTNYESIVSSGSSTNLSLSGRKGDFTVTSPGGLTVSFNSTRGRRRSSIAVIPQMQICPGDLLVYSKQLIDRMNQDESENEPPAQFLTIDDKKGKGNIWSSLKLCAQFDNRTMKARNELLCSLEDVLASLQPSTFVDEQLSHYKGMLWNEFLYETESRRSASSDALSINDQESPPRIKSNQNYQDDVLMLEITGNNEGTRKNQTVSNQESVPAGISDISFSKVNQQQQQQTNKESLKISVSSGTGSQNITPIHQQHRSRDPSVRGITSRFREKPKLKRGQTVDSVFRIPLIPSSPLKHAQQHQQTPTAHLEDHDNILITIEDDERSSLNSSASRDSVVLATSRHNRSSSTRSRSRVPMESSSKDPLNNNNIDSSFDNEDAMDLMTPSKRPDTKASYMVRQSSLSTLSSTMTRTEQKRQRALWDLFQSECNFFFDHLLTLKNVYMEPLKKIQVEGFAMFADPDVLFGNLDELCCGVYDFCKEFLYIIMRTLKTRPEELNATDVLIKLYKNNPKIDHLRGVYHRYTLNYINALTYLESLRKQVEFVEFEKWSSRDVRCKKLQLTDLLVAPVQHIMRVPIILKDIESHTENARDRDEIKAILGVEEASVRELDDKMRWLKNFERLLEIQKNISWPSVIELDPKLFIPEFLKEVLSKQPCERLIVSPRRQIVHEGTLSNLDSGKASDMHVILFDDMLLLTRRKKGLSKKASTVCKSNSGGSSTKDDGSFKYIVYKQPLSLDRFYVHDVQQLDAQSIGFKHFFMLIVMNRFQQISNVHSFSAPNDDIKQTWLFKIKKTAERWKNNFSGSANEHQQHQQRINIHQQQHKSHPQQQQPVSTITNDSHPMRQFAGAQSNCGQRTIDQVDPTHVIPTTNSKIVMRSMNEQASCSNVRNESEDKQLNEQQSVSKTPGGPGTLAYDKQNHHTIELIVTSAASGSHDSYSNITASAH